MALRVVPTQAVNFRAKFSARPIAALPSTSSQVSLGTRRNLRTLASLSTASPRNSPRKENVAGEFFVDQTCIDCDTCRWMAPSVFTRVGTQSAVTSQPDSDESRLQALQALLSCPTSSIRTHTPPADIKAVHDTFPLHIAPELPGVYHCGFHSAKSYSAASYYIQTPLCNVLVDSPRYNEVLASRLEALGGVDYIFLTHKDDVADHDKWAKRFGCPRIMHKTELNFRIPAVEIALEGEGPWNLPFPEGEEGKAEVAAEDSGEYNLRIIFTPGHTEGSCSLHLPPSSSGSPCGALFPGDHLALDQATLELSLHPKFNWYKLDLQAQSARNLKDLPFLWLLPGHGRKTKFRDEVHKVEELSRF